MSILKSNDPPTDERQMTQNGITRVPVDYFHFREFRYTSFADALAQAQRDAERDGIGSPDAVGTKALSLPLRA